MFHNSIDAKKEAVDQKPPYKCSWLVALLFYMQSIYLLYTPIVTRATIRDCALIISNHPHPRSLLETGLLLETWAFIRENAVIVLLTGHFLSDAPEEPRRMQTRYLTE